MSVCPAADLSVWVFGGQHRGYDVDSGGDIVSIGRCATREPIHLYVSMRFSAAQWVSGCFLQLSGVENG